MFSSTHIILYQGVSGVSSPSNANRGNPSALFTASSSPIIPQRTFSTTPSSTPFTNFSGGMGMGMGIGGGGIGTNAFGGGNQIAQQVHAFYLKHNPTKLDEIPKLLEKYKGQETELLRKLEKKYGVASPISSGFGGMGTGTVSPSHFGTSPSSIFGQQQQQTLGTGITSFGQVATSPFGLPAATSFGQPAATPFGQPASMSFGQPASTPFGQPASMSFGQPAATPFGQAASTPFGQPASMSLGQPAATPFGQAASTTFGQPAATPFGQPAATPFGQPAATPFGQPASTPFGQPAATPFGQLASTSFGQPAATPFGQPGAQLNNFGQQQQPQFGLTGSLSNQSNSNSSGTLFGNKGGNTPRWG